MKYPARLALRPEGDNWVAYYAMPHTMDGAIFLGSIRLALVRNTDRKSQFMGLMRDVFSDMILDATGERVAWPEPEGQLAPMSERSGSA